MRRLAVVFSLLVLLGLPAAVAAAPSLLGPTGLVLIPTAETLGMTGFNVGASGIRVDDGPDQSALYGNVGLQPGLEVGFIREKSEGSGAETLLNAKARLFKPPLGRISVAAGMMDITDQTDRTPYLVLSHTLGAGVLTSVGPVTLPQLHIGVGGGMIDGLFAGVSTTVNQRVGVMAEYDGDHVNLGARMPLTLKVDATVATLDGLKNLAGGLSFSSPW